MQKITQTFNPFKIIGLILFCFSVNGLAQSKIQWRPGNWANGCDFTHGTEILQIKIIADNCGPQCSQTPECTHFSWTLRDGGTCFLKQGDASPDDAIETNNPSTVCGFIPPGVSWGGKNWEFGCDFPIQDDIKIISTTSLTKGEHCGPSCDKSTICTHFLWTPDNFGTCVLKSGRVSPGEAINTRNNSNVCGYKVQPIQWNGKNWATGCEFFGQDFMTLVTSTGEQCHQKCSELKTECTHFTWKGVAENNGTCLLKSGYVLPEYAIATLDDIYVCGYIEGLGGVKSKKENTNPPPESNSSTTISTILGVLVFIFIAIMIFGTIMVLRKKDTTTHILKIDGLTSTEIQRFFQGVSANNKANEGIALMEGDDQEKIIHKLEDQPYDQKYEVPKQGFMLNESEILGSGAYGVVFKGKIWGKPSAVKTVKPNCDKAYLLALLSEVKVLIYLGQHENIVSLLGVFTSQLQSGVAYVFLEFCELGSLLSFLRKSKSSETSSKRVLNDYENDYQNAEVATPLSTPDFLMWSIQICNGLRFLADKKVIHGDVASRNVLLYSRNVAKLTDFGLSRRLYEYTNYVKQKQEPLPFKHMAIESLKEMEFSTESDIWSFGITLWEIFSLGDVPYPGLNWSQEFVYQLVGGLRPIKPRNCSEQIYGIMLRCWSLDPRDRSSFSDLYKELTNVNNTIKNLDYCNVDVEYTKI